MRSPTVPARGANAPALAWLGALVAFLLSACAMTGPRPLPGEPPLQEYPPTEAELAVQRDAADAAIADGRPWFAVSRAVALRRVPGLSPEARAEAERMLEDAMIVAAREAKRSREFDQVSDWILPRRPRAIHAVGRARLQLAESDPMEAYRTILALEREHPTHHLRPDAGDIVYRAGIELARGGGRYLIFFRNRNRASAPLEYVVVEHPSHPSADDAYAELALIYEEDRRLDLAIERHSDLLLYHPNSRYARHSEARVPELRLDRLKRDDFDRSEVERARGELERWLERHSGRVDAEEERRVRGLLTEAYTRLVRHDLVVARFYERVDKPFGARLHAERALDLARAQGFTELAEEAEEISRAAGDPVVDMDLDRAPPGAPAR